MRERIREWWFLWAAGTAIVLVGAGIWWFIASRPAPLKAGAVIAKGYDPPRDWIFMEPIPHTECFEVGSTSECSTSYTYIPIPEHDPEDWWVRIKACGEAAGNSTDTCRTRDVIVPQSVHDTLVIGQTYRVPQ